jgi:hypothetical protein
VFIGFLGEYYIKAINILAHTEISEIPVQKGTDGTSSLFFQLGCVTSSYSKNFC